MGGFRYLMERGAYHTDAHHDHYPLFTGPGHSIHFTGAPPYKTGIVGNDWFDRETERGALLRAGHPRARWWAAADPDGKRGISPATLRVSTVGDELKMATGGQAKVWGLALKDRAGVLMAGHLADGVLWFDEETSAWISSRFYFKDGSLPAWVTGWNAAKKIDPFFGKTLEPLRPARGPETGLDPRQRIRRPAAGPGHQVPPSDHRRAGQAGQGLLRRVREHPVRQ